VEAFISSNIAGEYVAILEEPDDFTVRYSNLQLGRINADTGAFTPELMWIESPDAAPAD
jgi:hypothetical protein